jgi:hypothetical protein
LEYLDTVMAAFGLGDCWSVLLPDGDAAGLARAEARRRASESELLLNVMGYLDDEEILAATPSRVFLDIDPGFGQMWRELGQSDLFAGHDRFVTVGVNVGTADCAVPDCGLDWIPTLPPVTIESWPAKPGGRTFTTIATWRGPYDPVEYEGHKYGLRAHEFRKFVDLPRRTAADFEIALAIDEGDSSDLRRLQAEGWKLVDPAAAGESGAEFTVAKGIYVDTRSGWFSDRSACYLASGKPVVAQDTGFGTKLPSGEGLLAYTSLDEAVAGIEEIMAQPDRHARAAREIAEEHLDSDRVLTELLRRLGHG